MPFAKCNSGWFTLAWLKISLSGSEAPATERLLPIDVVFRQPGDLSAGRFSLTDPTANLPRQPFKTSGVTSQFLEGVGIEKLAAPEECALGCAERGLLADVLPVRADGFELVLDKCDGGGFIEQEMMCGLDARSDSASAIVAVDQRCLRSFLPRVSGHPED